jgi:hypothetical protein
MASTHTETSTPARPATAFYTVANSRHFIGVVGLLNSLRLVGHEEPLFILDCGLDPRQREQLALHSRVVPAPTDGAPTSVKNILPLAHPADVMVLLDADVIVTRRLDEVIALARRGRLVAFTDDTPGRFFEEWADLGLGVPRRQTYVSAGHLLVPFALADTMMRRVDELAASVDVARTFVAGGDPRDPLYYLDQDVVNAVLATLIPEERLEILDARLVGYTPFSGLRLVHELSLTCRYHDGSQPLLLHHILDKPWLRALPENVYSRLLIRLLTGPDLTVNPDTRHLPVRLRTGRLAGLDRRRAGAQAFVRSRTRGRLGLRPRVTAWRTALARR